MEFQMDLGGNTSLDKYPKNRTDTSFSTDKTASFRAPKQMSTNEIEDFLKNQSLSQSSAQQETLHISSYNPSLQSIGSNQYSLPKLPQPDPIKESANSRAVANAMRALQDKVRFYESENERLTQALGTLEEKCLADRERWQQRFMEEMNSSNEKEKAINHKIFELEEEIRRNVTRTVMLEEQNRILEDSVKFNEREIKRNLDSFNVDKETLVLQLEHSQRLVQNYENEKEKHLAKIAALENEQRALQKEIQMVRSASAGLQKELEECRQTVKVQKMSLQKNLETVESQLSKQVNEYKVKIHQLEAKNKSWEDCCNTQNLQLQHLKRELEELHRAFKISEEASALKRHTQLDDSMAETVKKPARPETKEEDKPKNRSYMRPTSASTHKKRERSITSPKDIPTTMVSPRGPKSKPKFKCPQAHRPESRQSKTERSEKPDESFSKPPEDPEESLRLQISRTEQEIAELNKRYKQALQKASEPSADLSSLRLELNSLASTMESRSSELYDLKKQHQVYLREKISRT